jgi:hypothetical protein
MDTEQREIKAKTPTALTGASAISMESPQIAQVAAAGLMPIDGDLKTSLADEIENPLIISSATIPTAEIVPNAEVVDPCVEDPLDDAVESLYALPPAPVQMKTTRAQAAHYALSQASPVTTAGHQPKGMESSTAPSSVPTYFLRPAQDAPLLGKFEQMHNMFQALGMFPESGPRTIPTSAPAGVFQYTPAQAPERSYLTLSVPAINHKDPFLTLKQIDR